MRLVGQKFKGDAPCAAPWKCTRSFSNDLVVQPVAVLEFRGEFNYPALFMLLFCTILRRNYPARLNGQGLKSLRLFVFFSFSPSFLSFVPAVSLSYTAHWFGRSRGITILISPRFYRLLWRSVSLNRGPPPFNPSSSAQDDRMGCSPRREHFFVPSFCFGLRAFMSGPTDLYAIDLSGVHRPRT